MDDIASKMLEKLEKKIDFTTHWMLYYEMVIFGVVCPKIPGIVGGAKQGRRI